MESVKASVLQTTHKRICTEIFERSRPTCAGLFVSCHLVIVSTTFTFTYFYAWFLKYFSGGLIKTSDVMEYSQKQSFDSCAQSDTDSKDHAFLVREQN